MKARIPADKKLTSREKLACEEYVRVKEGGATRRLLKLMCVALHKEGFGTMRLGRVLDEMNAMINQKDEILWWHIDKLVIDQLGIAFEREEED